MPTIRIATPCHEIHRFVLPPHAEHVFHKKFIGGGLVLAQVLGKEFGQATEATDLNEILKCYIPDANSEDPTIATNAIKILKPENFKGKALGYPKRFLRLEPYDVAPPYKDIAKPKSKFLRMLDNEDGEFFDEYAQHCLMVSNGQAIQRNLYVVGGKFIEHAIETAYKNTSSEPHEIRDVVYLTAKSKDDIIKGLNYINSDEFTKLSHSRSVQVISQIDLADLAKSFPLQEHTSYERTIGDICRAPAERLTENGEREPITGASPMLSHLFGFKTSVKLDYLIIRLGNAAAVLIKKSGDNFNLDLFYHPDRCAPTALPGLGKMPAYDIPFNASIIQSLAVTDKDIAKPLEDGLKIAVQSTYRAFLHGFGFYDRRKLEEIADVSSWSLFYKFMQHGKLVEDELSRIPRKDEVDYIETYKNLYSAQEALILKEINENCKLEGVSETRNSLPSVEKIAVDYNTAVSPSDFWRMVVCENFYKAKDKSKNESNYRDQHRDLIREQATRVLNVKKAHIPTVDIGKLKLVDRTEVEDYLYLQQLLINYQQTTTRLAPISIGVFGQPGSGKSFGVKQLVSELAVGNNAFGKDATTFNLSQMQSLRELSGAFHEIRNKCLESTIPLIFFDEFDSTFEGKAFGWLKYFLAPMQDGEFVENGKTFKFGRAIFVFAGGVNHSFAEFNDRTRNPDFCEAKGPDFISRLRGILNIKSMNQPEGDGDIEHIYMLRRAVFLKSKLEDRIGKLGEGKLDRLLDENLAKAFLTVPRFKHGVRSMEAVIDMSSTKPGIPYNCSHLPPRDQLDMHVDAREFLRIAGISSSKDKN